MRRERPAYPNEHFTTARGRGVVRGGSATPSPRSAPHAPRRIAAPITAPAPPRWVRGTTVASPDDAPPGGGRRFLPAGRAPVRAGDSRISLARGAQMSAASSSLPPSRSTVTKPAANALVRRRSVRLMVVVVVVGNRACRVRKIRRPPTRKGGGGAGGVPTVPPSTGPGAVARTRPSAGGFAAQRLDGGPLDGRFSGRVGGRRSTGRPSPNGRRGDAGRGAPPHRPKPAHGDAARPDRLSPATPQQSDAPPPASAGGVPGTAAPRHRRRPYARARGAGVASAASAGRRATCSRWRSCPYPRAERTIAKMPALIGPGSVGHASATSARSGAAGVGAASAGGEVATRTGGEVGSDQCSGGSDG